MRKNIYIVWNENNNLGIPIIDEQHRGIISSINSLYYFIQSGLADEIIKPTMIVLEQYVKVHFKTEEMLLEEVGYPGIEKHKKLHSGFEKEIGALGEKLFKDRDSDMILKFLKEWWLNHINIEDKKYAGLARKAMGF